MSTIRIARRRRYAQIDRRTIEDSRLSFRARGVLAWLLDKPDGWQADPEVISNAGTEGRDAIRSALHELEEHGYLVRDRRRGPGGRWITDHVIYEHPGDADRPLEESPDHGGISAEVPQRETSDGQPALVSRPVERSTAFPKTENEPSSPPTATDPLDDQVIEEERIRTKAQADLGHEQHRAKLGERPPIDNPTAWLREAIRRERAGIPTLRADRPDPGGARFKPQDLGCELCEPDGSPGWIPIVDGPDAGRVARCPRCNTTERKAS